MVNAFCTKALPTCMQVMHLFALDDYCMQLCAQSDSSRTPVWGFSIYIGFLFLKLKSTMNYLPIMQMLCSKFLIVTLSSLQLAQDFGQLAQDFGLRPSNAISVLLITGIELASLKSKKKKLGSRAYKALRCRSQERFTGSLVAINLSSALRITQQSKGLGLKSQDGKFPRDAA